MAKLYEINAAIENFDFVVDEETGEVTNYGDLEALQMAKEEKLENIACMIKNLASDSKQIKEEEDALKARRTVIENRKARLEKFLAATLNGEKFVTPKCSVTWRKSAKCEITDADALVKWCIERENTTIIKPSNPVFDKTEITRMLKAGIAVSGAEMVESINMGVK